MAANRQTVNVYTPQGTSVSVYLEIYPDKVEVFDYEGDSCGEFPVPREGGGDPLAQAEAAAARVPITARVQHALVTEGRDPGIDALAIMCALLEPLKPQDRAGILCWLATRYPEPKG